MLLTTFLGNFPFVTKEPQILIWSNFLSNTRIHYVPGTFNIWIKLSDTGVNERDEKVLWVEKTVHTQKIL